MKQRLAIALVCLVTASAHEAAADSWAKIDDSDGITIFRREVPGSDVIAFKGEGVVAAPLVRVASVIFDTSHAAEWIDSLVEARVIRRISDTDYVEYDHFGMPLVIKDRDFVTENRLEYDRARKAITISIHSVSDPAAPSSSYVRGVLISSTFVLTPTPDGKGTRVSGDVHCNPAGSLPKWVVNFFQKDWPRSTLQSLRKQVTKPSAVENPAIRKLVDGAAADVPR